MDNPQLLVYKASAGSGKTFTLAVEYMNCHMPLAPTLETARGFIADSITAIALSSSGMSYWLKISSKIGI